MNIIFISGSRSVKKIPPEIFNRIDNIINNSDKLVVGDANGVDKLVQKYLFSLKYNNVTVFCSGAKCRNNLGNWEEYYVDTPKSIKGFQFYALKDKEMAFYATHALMIWDGKSFGTILNVLRMTILNKVSVLFDATSCNTVTFKNKQDWIKFYTKFDDEMIDSIYGRASKEELSYLKSLAADTFMSSSIINKTTTQQYTLF